jgi:hypothetical protein
MATELKDNEILFDDIDIYDGSGNKIIDVSYLKEKGKDRVKTGDCWIDLLRYQETICIDKKDKSRVWMIPVKEKTIVSEYGERFHPVDKVWKTHYGVDLCESGCNESPILAAMSGTVITAAYNPGGAGYYVEIEHGESGFITRYLHMGPADSSSGIYKHIVTRNQVVSMGQVIGSVGTSGKSTGPHLHFGMKYNGAYVDPEDYINFSSDSVRVQKESPTHDDFTPIFCNTNKTNYSAGTEVQQHFRRHSLMTDCEVKLYENGKMNRGIGAGNSGIGPTKIDTTPQDIDSIDLDDNNYFSSGVNPFIKNLMNNNAYCWARAKKIIDKKLGNYRDYFLCKNYEDNWYTYNIDKGCFDYGKIPRKYSIACWENPNSVNEKTRVAIVDEVIGTDVITITEGIYQSSEDYSELSSDSIHEVTITNPDGNWGQDKVSYKFLGFIYLLDNSIIDSESIKVEQDGCETVFATKDTKYASLTFSMHNIKHYNKIRLICDINAHDLIGGKSKESGVVSIMASQQVLRSDELDTNWYNTNFNRVPSYNNSYDFYCRSPFPTGAVKLVKLDMRNNVDTGTVGLDMTFPLNKCEFNNTDNFNTFSNGEYTVFNRELPLYISIIPVAYTSVETNSMTVEVTVKKIILYR